MEGLLDKSELRNKVPVEGPLGFKSGNGFPWIDHSPLGLKFGSRVLHWRDPGTWHLHSRWGPKTAFTEPLFKVENSQESSHGRYTIHESYTTKGRWRTGENTSEPKHFELRGHNLTLNSRTRDLNPKDISLGPRPWMIAQLQLIQ